MNRHPSPLRRGVLKKLWVGEIGKKLLDWSDENSKVLRYVARICGLGVKIRSKVGWIQLCSRVRGGALEILAISQFLGRQIEHFKHLFLVFGSLY